MEGVAEEEKAAEDEVMVAKEGHGRHDRSIDPLR